MKKAVFFTSLLATPAMAHDGVHLHPHDGASWMVVAAALAVILGAGALKLASTRSRA
ncbi:hypothetical protein [Pseudoprimorskyibacter insulae]|uniref:Peptidase M23 domain-containing protein n=1 Tax=Pseudoprimorskyibacter insulae TaxID=1695997 RepID=A0A2R8AZV1_9RHOB|nr:hypothetical protein [Pseudoprimorskyibacter insulae]SPF81572.1 hypothetical protein PRI8871_03396 [Pseudoprimorskyibacter insulae]